MNRKLLTCGYISSLIVLVISFLAVVFKTSIFNYFVAKVTNFTSEFNSNS